MSAGPLAGVRVVEIAGLGPGPFCGMMLADMGATVLRVDRPGHRNPGNPLPPAGDLMTRGRQSVAVDLKDPAGAEVVLRLAETADVLFEGFRPGVAERLGIGPAACLAANPRLVYGRMTGWGQEGPLAARAGHDINYIAVGGALHPVGPADGVPVPPLNLVGDFGGGGMLLAFGIVSALLETTRSGRGQVVDAAIVDGTAAMMTIIHAMRAEGLWSGRRAANLLDGGAHFYRVYECADGGYLSVGAIEPAFYHRLLAGLGLAEDEDLVANRDDPAAWPRLAERLAGVFRGRGRDEWCAVFDGTDACVAPVLSLDEVAGHPHSAARDAYVTVGGIVQPAPAPRFSRTPAPMPTPPPAPGADTRKALVEWGIDADEVERLLGRGAVHQS
ncbi:MAG TPA: CaiB/BaiF CoA-transferase family protein [Mycobacteriales bacterium]